MFQDLSFVVLLPEEKFATCNYVCVYVDMYASMFWAGSISIGGLHRQMYFKNRNEKDWMNGFVEEGLGTLSRSLEGACHSRMKGRLLAAEEKEYVNRTILHGYFVWSRFSLVDVKKIAAESR